MNICSFGYYVKFILDFSDTYIQFLKNHNQDTNEIESELKRKIDQRIEKHWEKSIRGSSIYSAVMSSQNEYAFEFVQRHFIEMCTMELSDLDEEKRFTSLVQTLFLPWYRTSAEFQFSERNPNQNASLMEFLKLISKEFEQNKARKDWSVRLFIGSICYGLAFMNQFLIDDEESFMRNRIIKQMIVDQDNAVRTVGLRFGGLLYQSAKEEEKQQFIEEAEAEIRKRSNEGIMEGLILLDTCYISTPEEEIGDWMITVFDCLERAFERNHPYKEMIGKVGQSFWLRHQNMQIPQIDDYRYAFSGGYYS